MARWHRPSLLADAEPCEGLTPAEVAAVWTAGRVAKLGKNQVLFTQGGPANRVYVVLSGSVMLAQVSGDGRDIGLAVVTPGEMLGCVAVLGGATYAGSATALETGVAIGWPSETFGALAWRYPRIGINTLAAVGRRLQRARERLAEMASMTAEQRIAATLLRLAARRADRPIHGDALRAPIPVARSDIAALAGTGLYTVSRTLQGWSRAGLVELGRCKVAVRDPEGLRAISGAPAVGDDDRRRDQERTPVVSNTLVLDAPITRYPAAGGARGSSLRPSAV